jgi:hypothetical protein
VSENSPYLVTLAVFSETGEKNTNARKKLQEKAIAMYLTLSFSANLK